MTMHAGDQQISPADGAGPGGLSPPHDTIQPSGQPAGAPRQQGRTTLGMPVERVPDSETRHPLTSLFLASLASTYGERITASVAAELGLADGDAGVPSAIAEQATHMAQTQMDVFDGANFFVELHCSAAARGAGFLNACRHAGIPPDSLDASAVDLRFRTVLAQASGGNQVPLTPLDGERLLEQLLRDIAQGRSHA